MLFMVIEHFKNGDPKPVGERFRRGGRMMPEVVIYHASWIDAPKARCFQIMEDSKRRQMNFGMGRESKWLHFRSILVQFVASSERAKLSARVDRQQSRKITQMKSASCDPSWSLATSQGRRAAALRNAMECKHLLEPYDVGLHALSLEPRNLRFAWSSS
jgi:Protein of unknown function (DUF3303)